MLNIDGTVKRKEGIMRSLFYNIQYSLGTVISFWPFFILGGAGGGERAGRLPSEGTVKCIED